jgi:hypothetical protein
MSDPEIEAMGQLATALDKLADDARARVLRWAADRYGAPIATETFGRARVPSRDQELEDKLRVPEVREPAERRFEQFVDLFDAVDPKSDVDKALTGAYWLQVVSKQDSWQSLRVNNLLKDMGHGVANVTSALRTAQERKPALVRQVHKSGRAQQSWKLYKLTTAGVSHIRRKLGLALPASAGQQDYGDDEE